MNTAAKQFHFICDVFQVKGKDKKADICNLLPPKLC